MLVIIVGIIFIIQKCSASTYLSFSNGRDVVYIVKETPPDWLQRNNYSNIFKFYRSTAESLHWFGNTDEWMYYNANYDFNLPLDDYMKDDIRWTMEAGQDSFVELSLNSNALTKFCMHVSVDENCSLDIQIEDDNGYSVKRNIMGFNKPWKRNWRAVEIITNYTGMGILQLIRNKLGEENCFWAISELKKCTDAVDVFTFHGIPKDIEMRVMERFQNYIGNISSNCDRNSTFMNASECSDVQILSDSENCNCSNRHKDTYKVFCVQKDPDLIINFYHKCEQNTILLNMLEGKSEIGSDKTSYSSSTTSSTFATSRSTKNTDAFSSSITTTTYNPDTTKNVSPNFTDRKLHEPEQSTSAMFLIIVLIILIVFIMISYLIYSYKTKLFLCRRLIITEEGTTVSENTQLLNLRTTIIAVSELEIFIRNSLIETDYLNRFKELRHFEENKSCYTALLKENMNKNYDRINVPYDETRVILKNNSDVAGDDYINASYIDGYGRPRAYIATQAPKLSTSKSFWRMVWENDVKTIIMAVNFIEAEERKCTEYFPRNLKKESSFGDISIKFTNITKYEYYDHRTFMITYQDVYKIVHHFHLKWNPELGKPLFPNVLVPMVKIMDRYYSENVSSPILVHCSLGIGRSALLILCHFAYKMAEMEGVLDFHRLVKKLRSCRPNMIDSLDDFVLAHLVVSECLRDKERACKQMTAKENVFKLQLDLLENHSRHDNIIKALKNTEIKTHVFVDGYDKKCRFFAKSLPNQFGVEEFWKSVLENHVENIVFLNRTKVQVWPFQFNIGEKRIVNVVKSEIINTNPYYDVVSLIIKDDDLSTTTIYKGQIRFIQFKTWPSSKSTPPEVESIIHLVVNMVTIIDENRHPSRPFMISCRDGITGTGLFMAFTYIVQKFLGELVYDIENGVRILRRENTKFVESVQQIKFLHQALGIYSEKFDPYASPE